MKDHSSLRSILTDLVAFKTVSGDYEQAAELLSYVRNRVNGHMHETDFVHNDFPSLILTTQKTKRPKVTLVAHADVVSAEPWQFQLVADDGKLYGRGVFDMKFAIACYIRLVEELGPAVQDYDFAIMLTSDEELGGEDGVKKLVEGGYRTDVCIIPDGASDWHIEEYAKGSWLVTLLAEGVTAHGSRPWLGDNASEKLVKALAEIQQLNQNTPDGTTVAVTQLQADTAVNQIPDNARANIDVRFMTTSAYEQARQRIESIAHKHGCQVETFTFMMPIYTDLQNPYVQKFIQTANQTLGIHMQPHCSLGSHDGKYFAAENIPVVVTSPNGGNSHGDQEWIDEQSLEQFYEVLKAYVLDSAKTN